MNLQQQTCGGELAWGRPGSSDEAVLREVLTLHTYRRIKLNFDVEPGEHWLDLGANVGAFALYCKHRGATAECYEPAPDCFTILKKNAPDNFILVNAAISNRKKSELPFWTGRKAGSYQRATLFPMKGFPLHEAGKLKNLYAGKALKGKRFDGIKMDIEGAEFGLIDEWLLPYAEKLVMEYHTSRDPSLVNLKRRLEILKAHYKIILYPPEFDRLMKEGGKPFYDRLIFCMGRHVELSGR